MEKIKNITVIAVQIIPFFHMEKQPNFGKFCGKTNSTMRITMDSGLVLLQNFEKSESLEKSFRKKDGSFG